LIWDRGAAPLGDSMRPNKGNGGERLGKNSTPVHWILISNERAERRPKRNRIEKQEIDESSKGVVL